MNANARLAELSAASNANQETIQSWLVRAIAEKLKVSPHEIKTDVPFDEYGLDSVDAVSISGELSDWLQRDLPGTLLFEYPTIGELAAHLAANPEH